jgi:hypothetical protein
MDIYLDTSHLQKWQQETLPASDILALNKLRDSGKNTFVLSLAHIYDITDREDEEKAIAIARFLDQLPRKWLRNAVDLKREEMKNAINCFGKPIQLINPFLDDYVDALEPDPSTTLSIRLIYRGSSIERIVTDLVSTELRERQGSLTTEKLHNWSHNNAALISNMAQPQIKNREMQSNLRRVLRDDINQFNLSEAIAKATVTDRVIDPIDTFIAWIIKNPMLISSILCPYYAEHFMLRNTTMSWKKSHIDDLTHLFALPYVDYLSVDKQMLDYSVRSLVFLKNHVPPEWRNRLITSATEIEYATPS